MAEIVNNRDDRSGQENMSDNINTNTELVALFEAVRGNLLEQVKQVVKPGIVNLPDPDSSGRRSTALHFAAGWGFTSIAEALLDAGANVESRDTSRLIPLHNSSTWGHFNVSKLLLRRGSDVNAKDISGQTPLHKAAKFHEGKLIDLLLKNGADTTIRNKNGALPIDMVHPDYLGIIDILQKQSAEEIMLTEEEKLSFSRIKETLCGKNVENIRDLLTPRLVRCFDPAPNSRMSSLLHFAAGFGCTKSVQLLLDQGANCHSLDIDGLIPLHNSCSWGHLETIEILCNLKCRINARDNWGNTPLHKAVANSRVSCIELLLRYGADVNIKNNNDKTAIELAKTRDVKVALMGDSGVRTHRDLIIACKEGQLSLVRQLVTPANVNKPDESLDSRRSSPLHVAAGYNKPNIVEFLLDNGANINSRDKSGLVPLHNACSWGHERVAEILILRGSKNCKAKLVRLLLKHGANTELRNRDGKTALELVHPDALHVREVFEIIGQEEEIMDAQTVERYSQLVQYCRDNNVALLRRSLNSSDINARDPSTSGRRSTLLHVSAGYGKHEVVNLLIQSNAKVNPLDVGGLIPLHNACCWGHIKCAEILLKAGASINCRDDWNFTPLHEASQNGRIECVKLLLQVGADPAATNNNNKKPVDVAKNNETRAVFFQFSLTSYVGTLPLPPRPVSESECTRWLKEIGLKNVSKYISIFEENEIDLDGLCFLTDLQLREMGVTAQGSRNKILHAISIMKQTKGGITGADAGGAGQAAPSTDGVMNHQIFLCYSHLDSNFMRRLKNGFEANGVRIWTDEQQVNSGTFWRKEIAQAILTAAAVVFVVSPHSVSSKYCQEEVQFAYDESIQIFPVILDLAFIDNVDAGMDMLLKRFQWCFFHNRPFDDALKQLLRRVCRHIKSYADYDAHALDPDRCDVDLRRGPKIHSVYGYVEHEKIGHATETLPPKNVFICWSHHDSEFVKEHLWADLESRGIECWIDFLQLEAGNFWRKQIGEAIRACKILLFVVSPASIDSKYCQEELQFAFENDKKIVPVIYRSATAKLERFPELQLLLSVSENQVDFTKLINYSDALADLLVILRRGKSGSNIIALPPPCHVYSSSFCLQEQSTSHFGGQNSAYGRGSRRERKPSLKGDHSKVCTIL